jgi:hypothetical protein
MMSKHLLIASRRTVREWVAGAAVATTLLIGVGCDSSQLETGYTPRRLSSSDAQRRAYYAPQYSREAAMAAQQQQQQGNDAGNMSQHVPAPAGRSVLRVGGVTALSPASGGPSHVRSLHRPISVEIALRAA